QINLLDQTTVQANLGVEQLVGPQRIQRLGRKLVLSKLRRCRHPGHWRRCKQRRVRDRGRRGLGGSAAPGGETAAHALFASEKPSLLTRPATGAAVLAICGSISFFSCVLMLLPALTSSSGTPRSMASRTSR